MYHILYNPGAGGDMVAAVIDSKDYIVSNIDVNVRPNSLREELKFKLIEKDPCPEQPDRFRFVGNKIFFDGSNKSEFMKKIEQNYLAITVSHDFSPKLQSITDTILIDDSEYKYAKWCMERCHIILPNIHPPVNEEEIQRRISQVVIAKKYGKVKVIAFQDILEGRLIEKLQQWIDTPLNTEVYNHWLNKIIAPLPKLD